MPSGCDSSTSDEPADAIRYVPGSVEAVSSPDVLMTASPIVGVRCQPHQL